MCAAPAIAVDHVDVETCILSVGASVDGSQPVCSSCSGAEPSGVLYPGCPRYHFLLIWLSGPTTAGGRPLNMPSGCLHSASCGIWLLLLSLHTFLNSLAVDKVYGQKKKLWVKYAAGDASVVCGVVRM